MNDTIAAIATAHQVAAIGIVRVSGPEAISYADRLFQPFGPEKLSGQADRKLIYGRLLSTGGELLDLCLCTVSHAPNSYTGEDTAEFQCHGSPMLLRTLLEELFRLGARQAGPGEFTKRAFLNGRLDLSSAEAVIDLIDAESAEAVRNAAGQLSGAMQRRVACSYQALTDMNAHFHAVLDYPDEDIEDFMIQDYSETLTGAIENLEALLGSYSRGRLMNSGIPTAIIGLPNAGKSSLLNRLLGYERAIVTEIPGTTRDTVEERVQLGGLTLRLIDTAGIRDTEDRVEKLGVARSLSAAENADLVLAVIDGSETSSPEDLAPVLRTAESAEKAIILLSKSDLEQETDIPETELPVIPFSSLTGEGLDVLESKITEFFPDPGVPAGEILTNARQAEAISRAAESMRAALRALQEGLTPDIILTETENAMSALGEVTGASVRDDITDRIFSRFCVGK